MVDIEKFYKTHNKVLEFKKNVESVAQMGPEVKSKLLADLESEKKSYEAIVADLNAEITKVENTIAFSQNLLKVYG